MICLNIDRFMFSVCVEEMLMLIKEEKSEKDPIFEVIAC